jgi:hypothetical protein
MKGTISFQQQKIIGLLVVAFVALASVYFGVKTIPGRLVKPFNLLPPGASGVSLDSGTEMAKKLTILKLQDTDQDGLSDYDEIYLYRTSPYLADSDSDGFPDKEEIEKGYDPNCPKGENCGFIASNFSSNSGKPSFSSEEANQEEDQKRESNWERGKENQITLNNKIVNDLLQWQSFGSSLAPSVLPNFNLTPEQIRKFLKESGFPEDQLAQIDDQTLLETWQESLAQIQKSPLGANLPLNFLGSQALGNQATQTSQNLIFSVKPSAQELRQMLLQAGMKEDDLKEISDEELLKLFEETKKNFQP